MRKRTSISTVTLDVRAVLETYRNWTVRSTNELDPQFTFTPPLITKRTSKGETTWEVPRETHDAFAVRERLFSVDDEDAALEFFRAFGPLRLDQSGNPLAVRLSEVRFLRDIRLEFLLHRSTISDFQRSGLKTGAAEIIAALFDAHANLPPAMFLSREKDRIFGNIHCHDVSSATQAAVYLDRLTAEWDECQECGTPYKKTSKHKRKYCSKQCLTYSTTQRGLHGDMSPTERREWRRRTVN